MMKSSTPVDTTPLLSADSGRRSSISSSSKSNQGGYDSIVKGENECVGEVFGSPSQALISVEGAGRYHCHATRTEVKFDYRARRTLILASIICVAFMIAETVGGLLAGSLAIMTDAAHLLTDFASFLISLFSLYIATRKPSSQMSWGWHRAEVVGAVISVLSIWVITGILVYMAIERIINQDYDIDAPVMMITAALGVCVNIIMGLVLHFGGAGHAHSHGGGHSHGDSQSADKKLLEDAEKNGQSEVKQPKRRVNINVRAAFIHVLGDFFQSLGVLVAACLIFFNEGWEIADPICTFIFSVLVLITTLTILKDALNVLMEDPMLWVATNLGSPKGFNFGDVSRSLQSIDGVRRVHDLRIWALTMDKVALSVHVAIDENADAEAVLKRGTQMLRDDYGVYESTVQIEQYSTSMLDCTKCEPYY